MANEDRPDRAAAMMLGALALMLVAQCGQEASAATPCPDTDPQKVTAGEAAPCDGWAISEGDALHIAKTKADLAAERKAHEATRQESVVRLRTAGQKLAACDERVGRLESALDDCESMTTPAVPWHESPEFVAPITAVSVAVVAVLVVVLVYETK